MAEEPPNQCAAVRPPDDLNPRRDPVLDFPDRELGEMGSGDYAALGFMAGLEVHQQLRTRSKLFCRCPAGRYVDHADAEVLRHMRPTLSELGEYDGCALMEFKTRKEIVYLLERGTVCTYEIDDTPPFEIDQEAVKIAIEVNDLFNLSLVSELHVMRKQYLDGSIPTGFQRTAMVGLGGVIPFRVAALGIDRELRIRQLSLEEDSCREVSDVGHRIVFRTDRLGMPLTEVVTEPDLLTPFELQAGARLVAQVTRTGGKVRRGPGAARQDVNVSVAGGRRIEIKGVSHHRGLPRLVHTEAFRQLNLLRIREELRRRGVTAEMLTLPAQGVPPEVSPLVIDATHLLRRCAFAPVRQALEAEERVYALRLPNFAALLTHRTQPGITFAGEFVDRARVIACLTGRPFLIHSDIPGYGLESGEWRQVRTALDASNDDAMIVLWGPRADINTAVREIFLRALDALDGVPAETRQAFADGTTGFERILPGADRMYPDTDTPPVPIPDSWVTAVRSALPERLWERQDRYRALGLSAAAAERLAAASWADCFDALAPAAGAVARRLAAALEKRLPYLARVAGIHIPPAAERLAPLVRALEREQLFADGFEAALEQSLRTPEQPPEELLRRFTRRTDDAETLDLLVGKAAGEAHRHMPGAPLEAALRWAMGEVMTILIGRVDPRIAREKLERALSPLFGS
jgi:glutamyl-tRNA(Gln) amidotransferase subunit E